MTQVVGESPFMKRVLIPFWVIRIIIMVIFIAVYALALIAIGALSSRQRGQLEDDYGTSLAVNTIIAVAVVIIVIVLICLILDIVCIVKRARRNLSPRAFLIINVIQTTVFVVMFILMMIGARTGISIALAVIMLLSFLGLLIYASVIFHQSRKGTLKRGAYTPAANPGSFQNNNAANISYASPSQYPAPPQQQYGVYNAQESASSTPKPYDASAYAAPQQQPQGQYAAPQPYSSPTQQYSAPGQQPYGQYEQQGYGQQQPYGQQYGQQSHELQSR